jgi:molybdopterin molybdotransferase
MGRWPTLLDRPSQLVQNPSMVAPADTTQRIARLTLLADVLARIDAAVMPVLQRNMELSTAFGRVLAADVGAPHGWPRDAIALIDGYAVDAATTLDASSYAPVPLPAPHRVDAGERLPAGADAVAAFDAVQRNGGAAEILTAVAPGAGVLPAGADMTAGAALRRAGEGLRSGDIAVLAVAGITDVSVRMPRVRILPSRAGDAILDAAVAMIARLVEQAGGEADLFKGELEAALKADGAHAVMAVGGTGTGQHDASVNTLARVGHVEVHGVGLTPGDAAAFGLIEGRPVLLIPGRIDAALAVFATLGTHLLARLSGANGVDHGEAVTLSRKITSTLGFAEFIPLRRDGDSVTPLGAGYLPMQALARADGWLLVPPDSEGYPAGASVRMRAWP